MRLDITEILRETGKNMPYDIHEPPLVDEDVECTKPIDGRIVFTNAGGSLLVRGKAETGIALPCSRCAQYFEQPTQLDIDEQFELQHLSAGPKTLATVTIVEEDESPVANKLFEGYVFNLTELLRQYILIDEPTQPLPPDTAEGKCSHCLRWPEEVLAEIIQNDETIMDEAEAPINPAFAKLGQLLDKNNE